MPIQASDVELSVNGKTARAYLVRPENGGPGVLLLHAWWGLKPFFKQVCERLAEHGFLVVAPDLREGRIAQTVEEAQQLMEASNVQHTGDTVMAAAQYLLKLPDRTGERIGVIGFSMGAAWALIVAAHFPEQVAAAALFYGAGDVDTGRVQAAILGHFSDTDEWEPYDQIQQLERNMKAAGMDAEFHTYPGRAHWFVEEDRPEYDADAAALAWSRTFEFLKASL